MMKIYTMCFTPDSIVPKLLEATLICVVYISQNSRRFEQNNFLSFIFASILTRSDIISNLCIMTTSYRFYNHFYLESYVYENLKNE